MTTRKKIENDKWMTTSEGRMTVLEAKILSGKRVERVSLYEFPEVI